MRGELADGGPIELFSAAGDQCLEPVVYQARQRHRDAQRFRRGEGEPNIFLSQGRSKSPGLVLLPRERLTHGR